MKKLNLEELSLELEVINSDQLYYIKGGYGSDTNYGGYGDSSLWYQYADGGGSYSDSGTGSGYSDSGSGSGSSSSSNSNWDEVVASAENGTLAPGTYTYTQSGYIYTPPTSTPNTSTEPTDTTGPGPTGTVTVGPLINTGVSGDISMYAIGNLINAPNYGIDGSWTANGGYSVSQNENTGQWVASVSLAVGIPAAFDNGSASAWGTVYVNGAQIGTITLGNDLDSGQPIVYQTGTEPMSGSLTLPSNFQGGNVTIDLNVGVSNGNSSGGAISVNTSQVIQAYISNPTSNAAK